MAQQLTLSKVQDYGRDPNTGALRLRATNYYISFKRGDGPTVFVQGGKAFHEGGPEFRDDELPAWFIEEAERVAESKREVYGLDRLLARLKPSNGQAAEPVTSVQESPDSDQIDAKGMYYAGGEKMYWCPECAKGIPSRQKGVHIGSHRREAKRASGEG